MRGLLAAIALVHLCGACAVDTSIYDPFPIPIDTDAGVVMLGARSTDLDPTGAIHTAVLDTGSALTIFSSDDGTVRGRATVELIGAGTGVPRAQFDAVQALLSPTGSVGEGAGLAIQAILGADLLVLHALHIDVTGGFLRITPNVAADETTLADSCQASLTTPLAGGGFYLLGNDNVRFPATRVIFSVCLAPPFDCDLSGTCEGGGDALLIVSTAVKPLVVSRSTYRRIAGATDADVDGLPTTTLFLPGNLRTDGVTVHTTTIAGLAIADRGNHGDDNPARGACLEYRASRLMDPTNESTGSLMGGCTPAMTMGPNPICPCQNGAAACAVGAAVETQRTLNVAILEDTDPVLQGLRDELRPNFADVSGFIGVEALAGLVVDIDYPHGRTVATCSASDTTCAIRPAMGGGDDGEVRDRAIQLFNEGCFTH